MRGIIFDRLTPDKLVVEASPDDVARFAPGGVVGVAPIDYQAGGQLTAERAIELAGATLYDSNGRAVCVVSGLKAVVPKMDVTTFGDSTPQFIQGLPEWKLDVEPLF